MQPRMMEKFGLAFFCMFAWAASTPLFAEDVVLKHKGIQVSANLEMAAGKKLSDGVILMTHGTLAHNRMEIMSTLQEMFKEYGQSTLAINLGYGIDNRLEMYDCNTTHRHLHTDALDEIALWFNWLKKKGARNIVLLGHSRGGNQTAWYVTEHDDPLIKKVVLVAPMTWDRRDAEKKQKAFYEKASKMVRQGNGEGLIKNIDFIYCKDTSASADSIVSYYKLEDRLDTPSLLKKINKPVLVFAGSEDTTIKNLVEKVRPLVDGKKIKLFTIDGADHYFRDLNAEEIVEIVVSEIENQ